VVVVHEPILGLRLGVPVVFDEINLVVGSVAIGSSGNSVGLFARI
jgi:hypothetical protein